MLGGGRVSGHALRNHDRDHRRHRADGPAGSTLTRASSDSCCFAPIPVTRCSAVYAKAPTACRLETMAPRRLPLTQLNSQ